MRAFGRRFLFEALFIVVVALVAGFAGLEWTAIVLVIGLAYLLVVAFELAVARTGTYPGEGALVRRAEPGDAPLDAVPEHRHVHVLATEAEPAAQPVLELQPEPMPEPELEPPPMPEPIPPVPTEPMPEPVPEPPPQPEPDTEAEPEPETEPESEPEPQPEPELEPEPEPQPEPEPEPEPPALELLPEPEAEDVPVAETADEEVGEEEKVVTLPVAQIPREWNVWELERLARESGGADVARDEERAYLLVYLREFASPEGTLPTDFDDLVRESFGDLLGARR